MDISPRTGWRSVEQMPIGCWRNWNWCFLLQEWIYIRLVPVPKFGTQTHTQPSLDPRLLGLNLKPKLNLINSKIRNLDVVFPNLLYAEIDEDAVPAVAWVIFYESSGATRPADGSISSEFLPFQTVSNGQTGLGSIDKVKFIVFKVLTVKT